MLVEDEAVGIVVADDNAVTMSEIDQFPVELHARIGAGRHIGIIGPHQLDARQVHLLQGLEIGLPAESLFQLIRNDFGLDQLADRRVGRITRIGHQYAIARIQESERDVKDSLLGADQRLDLALGIQFHLIPGLVPVRERLAQFRNADVWLVAMLVGLAGMLAQGVDCLVGRWQVRAADAQINDVLAGRVHLGDLFQLLGKIVFLNGADPIGGLYVTCFAFHLCILLISLSLLSVAGSPRELACSGGNP